MKIKLFVGIVLAIIVTLSANQAKTEETKEQIATQRAEAWLAIVDTAQYVESWNNASTYFKNAISQDKWIASMNAYRKPLGEKIERKLKSHQFMTSLPGAPDGEYVVIQFDTIFQNKKETIETITPMLEIDGTWRVSGYFIK